MKHSETDSNAVDEQVSLTEHLSALLDDEAGAFEQRRVLDELKSNDDLCKNLSRYALIGESMRSSTPVAVAGSDFLAGIHEQIDSDPAYHDVQVEDTSNVVSIGSKTNSQKSWLRPVGGFALAASVAAVSFLGVQSYQLANKSPAPTTVAINPAPVPTQMATTNAVTEVIKTAADKMNSKNVNEYRQANAHARSFLKRYVDSHMQYASTSTFVPSVRVIAYADYK